MKVIKIGFSEPTIIYNLNERYGEIVLRKVVTMPQATLSDVMEVLGASKVLGEPILIDSGYPEIINTLKQEGFRPISGVL